MVREWDDFGGNVRMRIYQAGAMEPATMSSDPNLPFMLYQFPNMSQPKLSGIPVLAAEDLPGEGDKPLKRPAANNVLKRPAKKGPPPMMAMLFLCTLFR